ncbi:MAG: hypothetical protein NTZ72_03570 [Afipia sp.]|nr:hypothetical protein [Afipia sp.]
MKMGKLLANSILRDFYAFVQKAFSELEGKSLGEQMYVAYICHKFQQLIDGKFRRMLVNLPGRHLKTFIGSICYPAFLLGINPSLRIMIVAYDEDLAADICRQIRDIMQSDWYCQIFATRVSEDHARKNDFTTTANGRVRAVSANGAITGRGGEVIIYDDPHNAKDWNNDQQLQNVRNQFVRLLSRRNSPAKCVVVVICHRVSENDLSAYILEKRKFKHVCLPLVATKTKSYDVGYADWTREKGTALQPENYPVEEIEELKEVDSGPSFWMHYQQCQGRNISRSVKFEDFRFFRTRPEGLCRVISVDASQKEGPNCSRSVIHVYETDGTNHYLVATFAEQCSFKTLTNHLLKLSDRYGPCPVLIEDTARGSPLIERVRQRRSADVRPVSPGRRSKQARLKDHVKEIRQGRIHLNEKVDGIEQVAEEVVQFPYARFTDNLDCLTQYLDFMATKPRLDPPAPNARAYIAVAGRNSTTSRLGRSEDSPSRAPSTKSPYASSNGIVTVVFGSPQGALVRFLKK